MHSSVTRASNNGMHPSPFLLIMPHPIFSDHGKLNLVNFAEPGDKLVVVS